MGTTLCLCDGSCGTTVPILDARHIELLTRWAIALQSYAFIVQHKPGKLHVVPDTLLRMFACEPHQEIAEPSRTPICRNVPDDPELEAARTPRPYQVSAVKLANL